MALVIDFDTKLTDGCKTFNFIDKVNWGTPEIDPTDPSVTDAFITFEDKDGVETILNVVASGFPRADDFELDITTLIGGDGTSVLSDQYFYLKYSVTILGVDQEARKLVFIDCTAAKCVSNLLADITIDDCTCNTKKVDNAILANTLLKAARQAACCNQTERWTELIAMVNKLCKNINC